MIDLAAPVVIPVQQRPVVVKRSAQLWPRPAARPASRPGAFSGSVCAAAGTGGGDAALLLPARSGPAAARPTSGAGAGRLQVDPDGLERRPVPDQRPGRRKARRPPAAARRRDASSSMSPGWLESSTVCMRHDPAGDGRAHERVRPVVRTGSYTLTAPSPRPLSAVSACRSRRPRRGAGPGSATSTRRSRPSST